MGRARPAALVLAVALGGLAAAQPAEPPLKAMRWLAPDADAAMVMTQAPPECLVRPDDEEERDLVLIGRVAFRTPVLLGGQAARAGLSCEACHRNGRGNPHFHFPGVSAAPGTADVTSSLFSTHRGNGLDDAKAIPDLGGPKSALRIPQAPGDPALETFIRGLVVEEFDGAEPPPVVLKGLAAYVRAMDPARCAVRSRGLDEVMEVAHDATQLAFARLAVDGDRRTAVFLILAARGQLGLVDERYVGRGLARLRGRIRALDAELAEAAQEVRAGNSVNLAPLVHDLRRLWPRLAAAEDRSLFNPERLSEAAKRRLPERAS